MENLPGVIPDAALVAMAFRAGLRTREAWHLGLPAGFAVAVDREMPLSLTVAGAVQASHLIPEHLASRAYDKA
jgi:hypothetical protein